MKDLIKVLVLGSLFYECKSPSANPIDENIDEPDAIELKIDTEIRFQTIHSFGASDAWSVQFVGKNWPIEDRRKISDLLFSTENKPDGSPAGIGLSAWRFNIGAGSAEQGSQSGITDEWRRAECFIDESGTYDWTKQAGQLWFLREAKARGVDEFIGFVNSPPVVYTKNGKAWSSDGLSSNLPETNYMAYANFLVTVVQGLEQNTGITFDNVSPFNEPQWEWKCCGQEGSPWNNNEISEVAKSINAAFKSSNLSTKIDVSESGQIDYLFSDSKEPNSRNNQVEEFFNPNSVNFIGDLEQVAHKIAGHSYFSTWDLTNLLAARNELQRKINEIDPSLEYWMSEYTILEDNPEIKGSGRDLGMDPAIYLARVIQSDLIVAQASAWHWWLAISPYDYKDGLVYIDLNKNSGQIYESKMLWALGHFSRFIRPGSVRVSIDRSDGTAIEESIRGLIASAYLTQEGELVVVLLNQLKSDRKVKLTELSGEFGSMSIYQTTAGQDMNLKLVNQVSTSDEILIPSRSIVTCLLK